MFFAPLSTSNRKTACANINCPKHLFVSVGGYYSCAFRCSCRGSDRYCNTTCQKEDFEYHKHVCTEVMRRRSSLDNIDNQIKLATQFFMNCKYSEAREAFEKADEDFGLMDWNHKKLIFSAVTFGKHAYLLSDEYVRNAQDFIIEDIKSSDVSIDVSLEYKWIVSMMPVLDLPTLFDVNKLLSTKRSGFDQAQNDFYTILHFYVSYQLLPCSGLRKSAKHSFGKSLNYIVDEVKTPLLRQLDIDMVHWKVNYSWYPPGEMYYKCQDLLVMTRSKFSEGSAVVQLALMQATRAKTHYLRTCEWMMSEECAVSIFFERFYVVNLFKNLLYISHFQDNLFQEYYICSKKLMVRMVNNPRTFYEEACVQMHYAGWEIVKFAAMVGGESEHIRKHVMIVTREVISYFLANCQVGDHCTLRRRKLHMILGDVYFSFATCLKCLPTIQKWETICSDVRWMIRGAEERLYFLKSYDEAIKKTALLLRNAVVCYDISHSELGFPTDRHVDDLVETLSHGSQDGFWMQ